MSQTLQLIQSWCEAKKHKEEADSAASRAEASLTKAANVLGERLAVGPNGKDDAPEQVCVWVPFDEEHEQLLMVRKSKGYGKGDYEMKFHGEKRKI